MKTYNRHKKPGPRPVIHLQRSLHATVCGLDMHEVYVTVTIDRKSITCKRCKLRKS